MEGIQSDLLSLVNQEVIEQWQSKAFSDSYFGTSSDKCFLFQTWNDDMGKQAWPKDHSFLAIFCQSVKSDWSSLLITDSQAVPIPYE